MKSTLRLLSGRKIQSPSLMGTRPTTSKTREAIINIIGNKIIDSHWLDLCSGSGVVGCEVLEKGAKTVIAIESNRRIAEICKSNLLITSSGVKHTTQTKVISKDVIKVLRYDSEKIFNNYDLNLHCKKKGFDYIYLDPPYESKLYYSILKNLLEKNWVREQTQIICECSTKYRPLIGSDWLILKEKVYGASCLLFLTPNQA